MFKSKTLCYQYNQIKSACDVHVLIDVGAVNMEKIRILLEGHSYSHSFDSSHILLLKCIYMNVTTYTTVCAI